MGTKPPRVYQQARPLNATKASYPAACYSYLVGAREEAAGLPKPGRRTDAPRHHQLRRPAHQPGRASPGSGWPARARAVSPQAAQVQ